MKLTKEQLKGVVKQCVVEVLRDDPRLARALVKEAIVDIFGERLLVGERATPQQPRQQQRSPEQAKQRPRRTNVPAMVRKQPQPAASRQPIVEEVGEPTDLFEALVADTMLNTLPDQLADDRRNPKTRSWEDMVDGGGEEAEEGPAMHLRRAQATPDSVRRVMHAPAQRQQEQPTMFAPASPIGEPSLAQVMEMYRQQQGAASQPQQDPPQSVDADISTLGLDGRNWDAHVDAQPAGGQSFDLAEFAASIGLNG